MALNISTLIKSIDLDWIVMGIVILFIIGIGKFKWFGLMIRRLLRRESRVSRDYDGFPYKCRIISGAEEGPELKLTFRVHSRGAFQIVREYAYHKWFKKLGLASEIQTGDPVFDSSYYIISVYHDWALGFFQDPQIRKIVTDLFDLGYSNIIYDGRSLTLVRPQTGYDEREVVTENTLPLQAALARRLPDWADAGIEGLPLRFQFIRFILFAIAGICALGGVMVFCLNHDRYPLLESGKVMMLIYMIGFVLWTAFVGFSIMLLKGRSSSHKEIMIIIVLSIIALVFGPWGGVVFLNGSLDKGEAQICTVRVIEKKQNFDSESYYAIVRFDGEEGKDYKIEVLLVEYKQLEPGYSQIEIVTRPGRLGLKWLCRYRILE